MPRTLEEPRTPGLPVVKRQRIGETFNGALVRADQRDVLKDGEPILKPNGKRKQELVLTLVAMPGTDATAGIGDDIGVPTPGDLVRFMLRGAAFGQWIEARKTHRNLATGDVFTHFTDSAQCYDANGAVKGPKITEQAKLEAIPRGTAVGVYGTLALRPPTPAEGQWVTKADAAHDDLLAGNRRSLDDDTDSPF